MGQLSNRIGLATVVTILACPLLACPLGCKKSEPQVEPATEASASAKPAVDAKIANAVQAAALQAGSGQAAGGDGLPPNGVLTAQLADSKAARGGFSSITLGSTGSEPRIRLGGTALGATLRGKLELAVRTGPRSAMPTVLMDLEGSNKVEAAQTLGTLKIRSAGLGAEQPGRIPADVATGIANLKGSSFSLTSMPTGRGAVRYEASATIAKGEFEALLAAAAETLETFWLSYPSEAVGAGAYWMSQSRESFYQADVLVFRLVKVEAVEGQKAKLNVATKRYLVGDQLGQMGLPPHTVAQYEAPGEAQLVVAAGAALPEQGQLNDNLMAAVAVQSNQGQPVPLQVGVHAQFASPPMQ